MTNERLREIRAAADTASPGPWVGYWTQPTSGTSFGPWGWVNGWKTVYVDRSERLCPVDAVFVGMARQAVPDLLTDRDRLHAALVAILSHTRCVGLMGGESLPGAAAMRAIKEVAEAATGLEGEEWT